MPKKTNIVETAVETVTTPEGVTSTAPAKKVVKKVAAKKVTVKKTVKEAATKAVKAVKSVEPGKPRARKEGLRSPQIRVLACLVKAKRPLTLKEICEKAPINGSKCTKHIGSLNDEVRQKYDTIKYPCLLTLKFVKHEVEDVDGKNVGVFSITAAGKSAFEKVQK